MGVGRWRSGSMWRAPSQCPRLGCHSQKSLRRCSSAFQPGLESRGKQGWAGSLQPQAVLLQFSIHDSPRSPVILGNFFASLAPSVPLLSRGLRPVASPRSAPSPTDVTILVPLTLRAQSQSPHVVSATRLGACTVRTSGPKKKLVTDYSQFTGARSSGLRTRLGLGGAGPYLHTLPRPHPL